MKKYSLNRSAFVTKEGKNKVFVFMGGESKLYSFKDTGATILLGLKQKHSDKKIVDTLVNSYSVDYKTAQADYLAFVKKLVKEKLLVKL